MTLTTARLTLRELDHDDAPFLLELLNDPDFIRHIADRGVRDLPAARRYLDEGLRVMYRNHGMGLWRVGLADDDTPVGLCGLLRRDWLPDPDLGYAFLPAFRGRGYALEAARATLDWGWRERGAQRVLAIVSPGNAASIALLQRLGFGFEGLQQMPGDAGEVRLYALQNRAPNACFP